MKTAYCFAAAVLLLALHAAPLPRADADRLCHLRRGRRNGRRAGDSAKATTRRSAPPSSAMPAGISVFPTDVCGAGTISCASAPPATSSTGRRPSISARRRPMSRSSCAKTSDLAAQLTNTEWFMSMPGTAEQKRPLIECMSCHTFERIVRSTYDAERSRPGAQAHGAICQQHDTGARAVPRCRARRQ